ncbi:MAG: altronate dehydratase [Deltaproteobacteria bacterium]|jgi:altronate hydrolase|nr:altronate dehydratase [Deltaproteobacteria bacterium]
MKKNDVLTIRLHHEDNVVVALSDLKIGTALENSGATTRDAVPAGHKVATSPISKGKYVYKYGQIIGIATGDIQPGEHVHSHNVDISGYNREYSIDPDAKLTNYVSDHERATFDGFVRDDGQVATRNYIGVLPSVACSASVCRYIADAFTDEILAAYPNVDGVVGITQTSGCGSPAYGEGFEILQRSLAGYARHPNFWGVMFVGLGCEVNQLELMLANTGLETGSKLHAFTIQETGGTRQTINRGVDMIKEMLPEANSAKRQPVSAANLVLGLECGGSDAYSGITANPALGVAADLVVRNGGTVILSETTEIYGAEHLLIQRSNSKAVADKLVDLIQWWEKYTEMHGAVINNNPTPGNKAGGLTTILEKSLGAVAKAGSTRLMEVYRYAETVRKKGLVFMDTPGYDLASITGMIAGGANMICFTTGCGTVLGCKPTPVIKLASNTEMFKRLSGDMDINCGLIVQGEKTQEEMGAAIFQNILDTASGNKTKSEAFGFGDNEFVPWHIGAVV